jgi:hypothetical protein
VRNVLLCACEQIAESLNRLRAENLRDGVPAERAIALELRFAEPLIAGRFVWKRLRRF